MVEWKIAESRQLLAQIVDFAAEFSWLYDFHGTQILDCGVLQSLPPGWKSTLAALDAGQLNGIAECQSRSEYPSSMQKFLQSCSQLSIHQLLPDASNELLPEWKVVGVGPKKRYEVPRLTRLVAEVQRRTQSQVVLDIGSGLGYVDSLLHHELGVRVLGVESEPERVLSARARHVRECGRECQDLQYLVWKLHDDRDTVLRAGAVIEQLVDPARRNDVCSCLKTNDPVFRACPSGLSDSPSRDPSETSVTNERNAAASQGAIHKEATRSTEADVTGESLTVPEAMSKIISSVPFTLSPAHESVTLLGLHACADLSPTMIRMFMCCNKISSMILLSCCYHKLKPSKLEDYSKECCSKASEDDPEPDSDVTRLSETSEGYESDVSDDCSKLNRSPQTFPKFAPIQKNSSSGHSNSDAHVVQSRPRCRRSSDPKCLFKNFPLSRSGSWLMCQKGFSLSVYGLRLACQEPGSRWRHMKDTEHRTHENALLFRAVLDSVCARHGVNLVKKKRRCASKDQLMSFENYLTSVLNCYDVISSATSQNGSPSNFDSPNSDEEHSSTCVEPGGTPADQAPSVDDSVGADRAPSSLGAFSHSVSGESNLTPGCTSTHRRDGDRDLLQNSKGEIPSSHSSSYAPSEDGVSLSRLVPALRECYSQNKHLGPLLEAITGLQLAMQGVLESFVLLDRVLYALESKFCSSVQLTKVFDAAVSPRCAALVLYK